MRNNRKFLLTGRTAAPITAALALVCVFVCARADADDAVVPVTAVRTVAVTRGAISQPVRAYGVVAASASNVTTLNLPYVARIVQMRVQPGQTVVRGAPLFVVQADPSAVVAAAQARSSKRLADDELARTQSLFDKSLATRSQLDAARKAALDARQAWDAQLQLGVGNGRTTIVAPHDGVVTQVCVAQGDQIQAGSAIIQLSEGARGSAGQPNVMLGVESTDAPSIHAGDRVTIDGLATPLRNARVEGRVVMVGAAIDAQTQLVNIGANVSFGPGAFMPGTRVVAEIATQPGVHWIVPRSAVLTDAHGAYVYQTGTDNKAHRVTVRIVVENGDRYGIEGQLDAKRPLVVVGNYELRDGASVRIDGGSAKQTAAGLHENQDAAQ